MSPESREDALLRTVESKQQLRELLYQRCPDDQLGRVTDWAWQVLLERTLLSDLLAGRVVVDFPESGGVIWDLPPAERERMEREGR
jgi:hypothetical protein